MYYILIGQRAFDSSYFAMRPLGFMWPLVQRSGERRCNGPESTCPRPISKFAIYSLTQQMQPRLATPQPTAEQKNVSKLSNLFGQAINYTLLLWRQQANRTIIEHESHL